MQPVTESELAEILRVAQDPFVIRGGGTRPIGRPLDGAPLETAGFSGIRLYEPGALTLVAGAGTELAEIERHLAAEGQRLPFEPANWGTFLGRPGKSTLGGVVAANVSGPRRLQAGACRDSLIGVRFVDGTGEIISNGGRVMKNVTGYDLVKLMAGSFGTLGVLTEVAFKLLPIPESQATILVPGLDPVAAVAAMAAAVGSPYEITGAAWTEAAGVQLRIEGFARSVAYRAERLGAILAPFGAVEVEADAEAVAARWQALRDLEDFATRRGDIWRFSVTPSEAPTIAARLGARALQLDWAGGLIWALSDEGGDLRARAGAFAGHATLFRASAETCRALAPFHPQPAPVAAIAQALRARFDPRGILNPGLML